jgi:hypothetical protein
MNKKKGGGRYPEVDDADDQGENNGKGDYISMNNFKRLDFSDEEDDAPATKKNNDQLIRLDEVIESNGNEDNPSPNRAFNYAPTDKNLGLKIVENQETSQDLTNPAFDSPSKILISPGNES